MTPRPWKWFWPSTVEVVLPPDRGSGFDRASATAPERVPRPPKKSVKIIHPAPPTGSQRCGAASCRQRAKQACDARASRKRRGPERIYAQRQCKQQYGSGNCGCDEFEQEGDGTLGRVGNATLVASLVLGGVAGLSAATGIGIPRRYCGRNACGGPRRRGRFAHRRRQPVRSNERRLTHPPAGLPLHRARTAEGSQYGASRHAQTHAAQVCQGARGPNRGA